MEKRSAAREIAFLACFQLPNNQLKLAMTDFDALCLSSLRTLSDHCKDNVKSAEAFLLQVERKIMDYQVNHPDNEQNTTPLPVSLPSTQEFLDEINKCYEVLNLIDESMQIPELFWHYKDERTKDFCLELVAKFFEKKESAENLIQEVSQKWDLSRIRKVDKTLISMCITEIQNFPIDKEVAISEYLSLASKYSTDESAKFINGIIADLIKNQMV